MTVPAAARRPQPDPVVPVPRRSPEPAMAGRDRSILMAVAAGRCTMNPGRADGLLVDGHPCTEQFAGHRLLAAGLARLVAQPPGRPSTVEITAAGIALLGLPITV